MGEDLKESIAIAVGWSLMAIIILVIVVNLIHGWFPEELPADDDITMDGKNYYPYERVLYCLQNRWECRK